MVYEDKDKDEQDEHMFVDVTVNDLEHLRWTGVTQDGYGTLAEVEEMLPRSDYDQEDKDEEESESEYDEN